MDRKLEFSLLRKKLLGDETAHPDAGRDQLILDTEAKKFGEVKGGPEFERIFFGMRASEAINNGYQITQKGYFESPGSIPAIHTAMYLREIINAQRKPLTILDPFAGIGHSSWAFAMEGFDITSIEKNPFTWQCMMHNIEKAGLSSQTVGFNGDGENFLDAYATIFSAVYLDLPWDGKYKYNVSVPFHFEDMRPNGLAIAEKSLKHADIVAVKTPQNIDVSEVRTFADTHSIGSLVLYQNVEGRSNEYNQVTVIFNRKTTINEIREVSVSEQIIGKTARQTG